jgi:SOS response regulatory protein OraA/RecX
VAGPAVLTALRRARAGRVALEVDGRPWRVVPDEVALAAGLRAGLVLDRAALRRLRRELRRVEAMEAAARVLAHRDLARERLGERLLRAGVAAGDRERTLASLERAGVVDDARLAHSRAGVLAARGWGDEAIRARLEAEGIREEERRDALAALAPEPERAVEVADGEVDRRRAAALLTRRGFSPDSIDAAVGFLDADG